MTKLLLSVLHKSSQHINRQVLSHHNICYVKKDELL